MILHQPLIGKLKALAFVQPFLLVRLELAAENMLDPSFVVSCACFNAAIEIDGLREEVVEGKLRTVAAEHHDSIFRSDVFG